MQEGPRQQVPSHFEHMVEMMLSQELPCPSHRGFRCYLFDVVLVSRWKLPQKLKNMTQHMKKIGTDILKASLTFCWSICTG